MAFFVGARSSCARRPARSIFLDQHEILWRNRFRQPDVIAGDEECVSIDVHLLGIDGQQNRLTVPLCDLQHRMPVGREMHMMPVSFHEPLSKYRVEVVPRRSVIEHRRRDGRLILQVDLDGMPLPGTDQRAVAAELESLFAVLGDNLLQEFE